MKTQDRPPIRKDEKTLDQQFHWESERRMDVYFSADVETDGPIPGPFSMLSFGLVFAGCFDGNRFSRAGNYSNSFYRELKPISDSFQVEALRVNGLDRNRLIREGAIPQSVMESAYDWVMSVAGSGRPVLVAYPVSFDWTWLYWYFIRFCSRGSPFDYSRCFDIKTAFAVKSGRAISESGRRQLLPFLRSSHRHTHNALDDAIEQAEIFSNIFEWEGSGGRNS